MDLDQLVLSGNLFTGNSRSSSPARSNRSHSPESKWPPEDFDEDNYKPADDTSSQVPQESIGMGPGRTGVKGVIRDRAEAVAKAQSKRSTELSALSRKLEATSLAHGGKTWAEDEDARRIDQGLEPIHAYKPKDSNSPHFGYLREVGAANFVDAVEDKRASVLVHIYDPYLDRCAELDSQLSKLARTASSTKFIRVKATAIGFALKKSADTGGVRSTGKPKGGDVEKYVVGEDLEFEEDDDDLYEDEAEADLDMLPTMLVYKAGELLHTWIRVDWEAGKDGIENLLLKHNLIAQRSKPGAQGTAALSDDEDEEEERY